MKCPKLDNKCGQWCPNCGSRLIYYLNVEDNNYGRGMTHYCKKCKRMMMIVIE